MARNVLGALFDVRPAKSPGVLDHEKIAKVVLELNLKSPSPVEILQPEAKLRQKRRFFSYQKRDLFRSEKASISNSSAVVTPSTTISKEDLLGEFEHYVNTALSPVIEVVRVGGNFPIKKLLPDKPIMLAGWDADDFVRLVAAANDSLSTVVLPDPNYTKIKEELLPSGALDLEIEDGSQHEQDKEQLPPVIGNSPEAQDQTPQNQIPNQRIDDTVIEDSDFSPKSKPVEKTEFSLEPQLDPVAEQSIVQFYDKKTDPLLAFATASRTISHDITRKKIKKNNGGIPFGIKMIIILGALGVAIWVWSYLFKNEGTIKSNIIQNGKNAVSNLQDARENLEHFKFKEAADNFTLAYDDFNRAGDTLNKLGALFTPLASHIPGLKKISSATNLVAAGRNMSSIGREVSTALGILSDVPLSALLGNEGAVSLHDVIGDFDNIIRSAHNKITRTGKLLANVDSSLLPENKRELFNLFKEKLPELANFLFSADSYADILLDLIPSGGEARYLVLFQNNTELRATGGFPGSYGLITFKDGVLKEFKVDDSYNPDGQLREKIVPPQPLQHITPTWGMRDANWFADFPTSAQKVMQLYEKSTGVKTHGVLTITPDVITDILGVVGPVEMPEYGIKLDKNNFLPEIQQEVEYGGSKAEGKPKKILSEFTPKFLEKLGDQDGANLAAIIDVFHKAMAEKRILAYFDYSAAEKIAIEQGIGGELKASGKDYLQVVLSNIKGFKTDFVTRNSLKLRGEIKGFDAEYTLEIIRTHEGGNLAQKFYNLPNSSYIRVYLPANAEFLGIGGNSNVNYKPLANYQESGFTHDADLAAIETATKHPAEDVDEFIESGKRVIGFWMNIDPQKTKKTTLSYRVPGVFKDNNYRLLIQKQSGLPEMPLEFSLRMPSEHKISGYLPGDLQLSGNTLTLKTDLKADTLFEVRSE